MSRRTVYMLSEELAKASPPRLFSNCPNLTPKGRRASTFQPKQITLCTSPRETSILFVFVSSL